MLRRTLFMTVFGLSLFAAALSAQAQSFTPVEPSASGQSDNYVPLKDIFARLKAQYGGYQLDADLYSTGNGGAEYRIEWMARDGRRLRIVVDARSGRTIRTSGG
ncbi:MAG: peptidase [Hyphomonadaceae bacterium]|nr:peptidase [Hyphomonadaceae bacterium]